MLETIISEEGEGRMKKIRKAQVEERIREMQEILDYINNYKKNAPIGHINIVIRQEKTYYQWQYKNEHGKKTRKYISKKNIDWIRRLVQKNYYEKIEGILNSNLKALETFHNSFMYDEIACVYDEFIDERKVLITPIEKNREQIIKNWLSEIYEKNMRYPETLRYETSAGEYVRSKSEVIIANLLYAKSDKLLYKYERPLLLKNHGQEITIYPDFTILNMETGEITYWEHAGLMNNSEYVSDFVWKNNLYYENHLLPGKKVVFTYESEMHPLEIGVIQNIIRSIYQCNT